MKNLTVSNEFLLLTGILMTFFVILIYFVMAFIKRSSDRDRKDRYDEKEKMIELEYIRKNMEMQLYDVSRKLEENERRWRDINHLVITSQNRSEAVNSNKSEVLPNDFLKNLGVNDGKDYEVDNRQVFVLTPFNPDYTDTFKIVRKVCEKIRLKCIRGDEEYIPNDIFPVILKQIVRSRFIVANITGRNPNVMYELGVAHALNKPTIIIAKNFTDIPFDLNNKRIIIFEDDIELEVKLENSLNDLLINRSI